MELPSINDMIMVCNLGNFTGDEIRNCPPYSEGKERLKKEAEDSRLAVAGSVSKELPTRLG